MPELLVHLLTNPIHRKYLQVEPGNAIKNYSKKQKQTTATVLQPNNNATMSTNATNMVGQILMTPTNVTQIDLGKIGMHAYKMDVS